MSDAEFAIVQLVGSGRLLAYTITFSEGDPQTAGNWNIPEITPPVAQTGLKVTGSQQELVTAGTIKNDTGTLEYSLDNSTWSIDVPKATNAGSYTVYYRLKYDNKYYIPLQGEHGIPVSIEKAEVTVTAKDQSIYIGGTVPTLEGEDFYTVIGLMGEDALTTTPTLAYQKNGEAVTPDNTTAGTYDIVASGASAGDNYTIRYTNGILTISEKQPATVTKVPEAKTLTYNGQAQELVTAGTAEGGTMYYAVTTENTAPTDDNLYDTSIPTATDAGTYYVWYMVAGDANHVNSTPECIIVIINESTGTYTTVSVTGAFHVIGDGTDAVIIVKRSENDALTYKNFESVSVGGKAVAESNYAKKEGSLILTLKAAYLDTLAEGDHKVDIIFSDGSAETTLRIAAMPDDIPKTGDNFSLAACLLMLVLGILGICGVKMSSMKE